MLEIITLKIHKITHKTLFVLLNNMINTILDRFQMTKLKLMGTTNKTTLYLNSIVIYNWSIIMNCRMLRNQYQIDLVSGRVVKLSPSSSPTHNQQQAENINQVLYFTKNHVHRPNLQIQNLKNTKHS